MSPPLSSHLSWGNVEAVMVWRRAVRWAPCEGCPLVGLQVSVVAGWEESGWECGAVEEWWCWGNAVKSTQIISLMQWYPRINTCTFDGWPWRLSLKGMAMKGHYKTVGDPLSQKDSWQKHTGSLQASMRDSCQGYITMALNEMQDSISYNLR